MFESLEKFLIKYSSELIAISILLIVMYIFKGMNESQQKETSYKSYNTHNYEESNECYDAKPEWMGVKGVTVVLHYTDWCGYCKRMKPVWADVKKNLSNDSNITFLENNEDEKPSPDVKGVPAIFRYENGEVKKYNGPAEYQQLYNFIKEASLPSVY